MSTETRKMSLAAQQQRQEKNGNSLRLTPLLRAMLTRLGARMSAMGH